MADRLRMALPYVITLIVAVVLWALANTITYDARPGQLGPTFWPRIAIGIMALAALYEIARIALSPVPTAEPGGLTDALDRSAEEVKEEIPRKPLLLAGGIALTFAYAMVVTTFGFILSNFLFLTLFMYLGGYRNHRAIWFFSVLGTLAFAFVFLRFAYVSVPRGVAPFDLVTHAVLKLLGGQ